MRNKKNKKSLFPLLLTIILILLAAITLTVTIILWQKAAENKKSPLYISNVHQASSREFSAKLEENLRSTFSYIIKDDKSLKVIDTAKSKFGRKTYEISISENMPLILINARLTKMVNDSGGTVFGGKEEQDGNLIVIQVGAEGKITDIVVLKKVLGTQTIHPRIAIIVDDLGIRGPDIAERLCNLRQTVTLSILPFQKYTASIIAVADKYGTPYMLHMPMEPLNGETDPGEGAIYTSDEKQTVIKKLEKAFKSVPGAKGLNNHMGSKTTEDVRTMETVMGYLRENDYFFVDSRTSVKSRANEISQKSGVKSIAMYTYLDAEDKNDIIIKKINMIYNVAVEKGPIVVICHARPLTVSILEKKLPELEKKGISFVKVTEMLH